MEMALNAHLSGAMDRERARNEKIDTIRRAVDGHDAIIHGNGKPGIKTDVEGLKDDVERWNRAMFSTIGAFVVAGAGVIVYWVAGQLGVKQ